MALMAVSVLLINAVLPNLTTQNQNRRPDIRQYIRMKLFMVKGRQNN